MRIKRFHGNITILALFVLLASALTGVLVALYMKNFMKYSEEITNYEKSSYMAKAGTELGLAIVGSHNVGLEYSFGSGSSNFDTFIKDNFDCPYQLEEGENCPNLPYFSLAISGMNTYYNMCSPENQVTIGKGLSAIIPLFRDRRGDGKNNLDNSALQKTADSNLVLISLNNNSFGANGDVSDRNFGTLYMQGYILQLFQRKNSLGIINNGNEFIRQHAAGNQNPYLVVANPDSANSRKLCIRNNDGKGIPQETVVIKSIGYYKDKQLGTETLAKKALPEFLQGDNYLVQ